MLSSPIVGVCPIIEIPRWGSPSDTTRVTGLETGSLADVLSAQYGEDDAYVVPYRSVGETTQVPLKASATSHGVNVVVEAMFFDFDRAGHEPWEVPADARRAAEAIAARLPEAAVYGSRGGVRIVLLPEQPIPSGVYRFIAKKASERVLAAIHEAGYGDLLTIDPCSFVWSTHYRVPHCTRGDKGEDVSAYAGLVLPNPWPRFQTATIPPTFDASVAAEVVAGDAPEETTLSDEEWAAIEENLGPWLAKRRWPTLLASLRKGERFYKPGERNATAFQAVRLFCEGVLSVAGEPPEAEDVYKVFAASMAASQNTPREQSLKELWSQCARACAEMADRAQNNRFRAEEIEAAKSEVGATGLPTILFQNNNYFVLDTTKRPLAYRPCVTNGLAVPTLLEQYCSGLGVSTTTEKGAIRPLGAILKDYAKQVKSVVYAMGDRGARFDEQTSTLVQGILPMPEVAPVYHADIAAWLAAICPPEDHEAVLDWLATARRLDRPTCTLYFCGPPGFGKQVFATGLGRALSGAGAIDFDQAMEDKNGALMESAVVFLDEKSRASDKKVSALYRKLSANTEHTVRPLYHPACVVRGAYRIVVGANNEHALPLHDAETRDDVAAVVERVRFIRVPPSAKTYMEDIGGYETTHDWVEYADGRPGKFAEHLVWLEKNRTVVPGKRFLVAGVPTPWHEDILSTTSIRADVLSVVARGICSDGLRPGNVAEKAPDIIGALHGVWVDPVALRKRWFALSSDPNVPSARSVATALRAVRVRETRTSQGMRFLVPANAILSAAAAVAVGDSEKIERLLTPSA